jgi:type IV secretory pathway VirB10-like protein
MIDPKQTPDSIDETLVEHFRQHASGEPPASMDAFILATARREAPIPAPSLWQRWLQACQRPRWQMAFATVAGVALMIGLVLRTPAPEEQRSSPASMEFSADRQQPPVGAAPPPAMPAPAPVTRMAPQGELARAPASPMQAFADKPATKMSKSAPAAVPTLEQELLEVLRLREAGDSKAADEKLLALHKRFPKEDLPARLEALRNR